MREIKFRAKDIKTNKWVHGGYYKHLKRTPCPIGDSIKANDYEHLIINSGFSDWNMPKPIDCFAVDEKTVGQYTGLKDKNGKEIFEGDILGNEKLSTKWAVGFNRGAFVLTSKGVDMGAIHSCSIIDGQIVALKILGNIYENKDLLEE